MAFPDRIERTVRLDRPPAAVWPTLTTADRLAAWFGDEVETGFAQLADDVHAKAYDSHVGGWAHELGELVGHVRTG